MFDGSPTITSQFLSGRSSAVPSRSFRSRRGCSKRLSWFSNLFFFSPQDLAIILACLVGLYMIMGDNAEMVCNIFTSLPPAIFTWQLLTKAESTKVAYEAALCFWILHGTLVLFDNLLRQTVWYFLAKFVLMAAVFSHVLSKCRTKGDDDREEMEVNRQTVRSGSQEYAPKANASLSLSSSSSSFAFSSSAAAESMMARRELRKRTQRKSPSAIEARRSKHDPIPRCSSDSLFVTPKRRVRGKNRSSPHLRHAPVHSTRHHLDRIAGGSTAKNLLVCNDASEFVDASTQRFVSPSCAMRTLNAQRTQCFQSLSEKLTPEQDRLLQFNDFSVRVDRYASERETVSAAVQTICVGDSPLVLEDDETIVTTRTESTIGRQVVSKAIQTLAGSTFAYRPNALESIVESIDEDKCALAEVGNLSDGDKSTLCGNDNNNIGAGDMNSINMTHKTIETFDTGVAMSSLASLDCGELILNKDRVTFTKPFNHIEMISMANGSTKHNVAWMVKTNAVERIMVTPNCGILPIGKAISLILNVRHEGNDTKLAKELHRFDKDRLVIDYVCVPPNCVNFVASLLAARNAKRFRKNVSILYFYAPVLSN